MSSKENAAVSQLLAQLESAYAMRVVGPEGRSCPQTFRLLQDSVGGITPNTPEHPHQGTARSRPGNHGGRRLQRVTPNGRTCSRVERPFAGLAIKRSALQSKKKIGPVFTGTRDRFSRPFCCPAMHTFLEIPAAPP